MVISFQHGLFIAEGSLSAEGSLLAEGSLQLKALYRKRYYAGIGTHGRSGGH
jgi:hypothetical protein